MRIIGTLTILAIVFSNPSFARSFYPDGDYATVTSDATTQQEVDRIRQLTVSRSAALNQEALAEARKSIESYSMLAAYIDKVEKVQIETLETGTMAAFESLTNAIAKRDIDEILEQRRTITNQLDSFEGVSIDDILYESDNNASLKSDDRKKLRIVAEFLGLDPEEILIRYKDDDRREALRKQLVDALGVLKQTHVAAVTVLKGQAPRVKKLKEAWEGRRDILIKAIEDQSAPASKVAGQLAMIIGVFCAFGILMFLAVRFFSPEIQLELIASGQVIQFATVMVLLIVVCVLGMSEFLTENTLGTLLGGIGGYVLSQGVGRAVSRAHVRESQSTAKPGMNLALEEQSRPSNVQSDT